MSTRCTCCHVCHTSLKTSRRAFFPCSECPTIICRQCIEATGQDWEKVNSLKNWSCPRCCGDCPCKRCRNKVVNVNGKSVEKKTSNKRKRSPETVFEDNAFLSMKSQKIDATQSSPQPSSRSRNEVEVSAINKDQRIMELYTKNKQCLDYITRTERLLTLIRSEQGRIQDELEFLTRNSSSKSASPLSIAKSVYTEEISDSDDIVSSDDEVFFTASSSRVISSFPNTPRTILA